MYFQYISEKLLRYRRLVIFLHRLTSMTAYEVFAFIHMTRRAQQSAIGDYRMWNILGSFSENPFQNQNPHLSQITKLPKKVSKKLEKLQSFLETPRVTSLEKFSKIGERLRNFFHFHFSEIHRREFRKSGSKSTPFKKTKRIFVSSDFSILAKQWRKARDKILPVTSNIFLIKKKQIAYGDRNRDAHTRRNQSIDCDKKK